MVVSLDERVFDGFSCKEKCIKLFFQTGRLLVTNCGRIQQIYASLSELATIFKTSIQKHAVQMREAEVYLT
jgi:hypothetical protein